MARARASAHQSPTRNPLHDVGAQQHQPRIHQYVCQPKVRHPMSPVSARAMGRSSRYSIASARPVTAKKTPHWRSGCPADRWRKGYHRNGGRHFRDNLSHAVLLGFPCPHQARRGPGLWPAASNSNRLYSAPAGQFLPPGKGDAAFTGAGSSILETACGRDIHPPSAGSRH